MDNWKDLLKVAAKDDGDPTKWMVGCVEEVTTHVINGFSGVLVLHHDFIPDDEPHGPYQVGKASFFCDGAVALVGRFHWGQTPIYPAGTLRVF